MSQRAANYFQAWLFAELPNGARGIIDGSGECLENVGKGSSSITLAPCTLRSNQQFFYTETGQITTTNGKYCLEYAAASQSAAVILPKCVDGLDSQVWHLAH
jgi:hypothetical protein